MIEKVHELKDAKFGIQFQNSSELVGFYNTAIILKPCDFGLLLT